MSLRPQHSSQQQRVVADGWGRQASGSVFCAESSLRFIYESQPEAAPGTTAAAISSLASGEYARSTLKDAKAPTMYGTSYDKLHDGSAAIYGQSSLMMANMLAAKLDPAASTRGADGVDLFEAEIAKACAQITRQAPSLPHSFRECSVCLTQNAYAQIAVCGHTFHSKCFLRWFRTNRSCPLCRGPVDKIQLAPVVSVQDELEALMAEMDDEVVDPLMENPDLISFLGADFDDADMDMMALDDMPAVHDQPMKIQECAHDDVSMEDDQEQAPLQPPQAPAQAPSTMGSFSMQLQMPVQYAPTSTMPNYWNVLNQGMSLPPVMPAPIMPAPQQQQHVNAAPQAPTQQSRMVHIAPKPDGHFHHQHTHQHQHIYGHAQLPPASHPFATARAASPIAPTAAVAAASAPRVVSCRCTGGCRNGRCACVKEGAMCGVSCRCTSCKNPFLMVKAAGADIDALFKDACFMHNVSKTRDMVQRMQEPVDVPCCERTIKVIDCVQGYKCTACGRTYDFSWCMNKLLDHDKTPRNHCEICKRCCDHRDVHCNDCGRCYFAGVAASLPCPCKESSRKRRDNQNEVSAVKEESNNAVADGEEKEGECSIM